MKRQAGGVDWKARREAMVTEQLAPRGIHDARVLETMRRVSRHLFVPAAAREHAYEDRALAIGHGQTISQPYIVGVTLQALALEGREKVLEIGAGSGYQTVLLAALAGSVEAVEIIPELASEIRRGLAARKLSHVRVHQRDGSLGLAEEAPFDRIVVSAAAPEIPPPLLDQLRPGGKLVIPIGVREHQTLTGVEKEGGEWRQRAICECLFVPLVGKHGWGAI